MTQPALNALLRPKSIAILGASERPGSIGSIVISSLRRIGFDGEIWPVNPRYPEVHGLPCFKSLQYTPGPADLVALCTKAESVVEHLEALAAAGSRAAVVYDGGFAEAGPEGKALQEKAIETCERYGIALCGPNCMGAISFHDRATTYKLPLVDAARLTGNVGLISQSGSITIGLLGDVRRFGYSYVVSTGNEAVVDMADYVDFLVQDPHTRVIALFVESIRSPARFRAALERAAAADKPVVLLKVGRSKRAVSAVVTHTGGLAGELRVFSEVLKCAGAIEVQELDEMTEILAALQAKHRPAGPRIGVITGSGGQAELLLDIADTNHLELPPMDAVTKAEAERVIGHFSGDGNPLDAWGSGDIKTNLPHSLGLLTRHPDYDAVVLCNENIENAPIGRAEGIIDLFCTSAAQSSKPHYCLNMRGGLMHLGNVALLDKAGAAMLAGARQGLRAIDLIARREQTLKRPKPAPAAAKRSPLAGETRKAINEYDAKQILRPFGVPVTPETIALTLSEGLTAAQKIGWPVVLKIASDLIAHKTEAGLVALNLRNDAEFEVAWKTMEERARAALAGREQPKFLVQAMATKGLEMFVGVRRDPQWGLVLAFGVGGTLIEIIKEVSMRMLPVDDADLDAMLRETRAWALLSGARGDKPADIDALKTCLRGVADFAMAAQDQLAELDLNPIKVMPAGQGCVVVDAFIQLQ